jgi:hypothetical protein
VLALRLRACGQAPVEEHVNPIAWERTPLAARFRQRAREEVAAET